ncbi:PAS domain-containing protein [Pontibacter diazotrophicus]|nr:PAS domain S-box protein [Pontibacter diazotrophicus]
MHQDSTLDYQAIFNTLPGNFLVLQPNPPLFTILAISDSLLQITNQERHNVVGKSVFEAYPENPDDSTSSGPSRMRDYLQKTLQEKKIDQVPLVRYDVPNTESAFEARYWSADSRPVLDAAGNVAYILHTAIDITQQVTAQKQLEDQKGYLQSAVDIADLGTFKVDIANDTGTYSEAAREWFDFDSLRKPMADIFSKLHPEDAERVTKVIADSLQSEERGRHDITYRLESSGDQGVRHLRSIGKTMFAEGKPHSIIGIIQDVTPQVSSQKKLLESESRFRNLLKQAPVAIALTRGQDMVIENVNGPMLRIMYKETEEEVIGKKLVEALPEVRDQPILQLVLDVLKTGEPFKGSEVPVSLREGGSVEQHYFNVSYTPLIEEGIVTGVIHTAIDVTEQVLVRKKAEESQEALKRFKFMADQARDAFILMREDGSFAYLNPKALEAWDYKKEEAENIRVPDVDPVYQEELFSQLFARAQQETIPQFETLHKKKNGQIYPVEVTVVGLKLDGEPHLFALARDITERKRNEAALELKNNQLTRINNDLDNFIYTASHDLKAPIFNIEGLLSLLSDEFSTGGVQEDESRQIIDLMQQSVERFKKTIESLTDVVRLQQENEEETVLI